MASQPVDQYFAVVIFKQTVVTSDDLKRNLDKTERKFPERTVSIPEIKTYLAGIDQPQVVINFNDDELSEYIEPVKPSLDDQEIEDLPFGIINLEGLQRARTADFDTESEFSRQNSAAIGIGDGQISGLERNLSKRSLHLKPKKDAKVFEAIENSNSSEAPIPSITISLPGAKTRTPHVIDGSKGKSSEAKQKHQRRVSQKDGTKSTNPKNLTTKSENYSNCKDEVEVDPRNYRAGANGHEDVGVNDPNSLDGIKDDTKFSKNKSAKGIVTKKSLQVTTERSKSIKRDSKATGNLFVNSHPTSKGIRSPFNSERMRLREDGEFQGLETNFEIFSRDSRNPEINKQSAIAKFGSPLESKLRSTELFEDMNSNIYMGKRPTVKPIQKQKKIYLPAVKPNLVMINQIKGAYAVTIQPKIKKMIKLPTLHKKGNSMSNGQLADEDK